MLSLLGGNSAMATDTARLRSSSNIRRTTRFACSNKRRSAECTTTSSLRVLSPSMTSDIGSARVSHTSISEPREGETRPRSRRLSIDVLMPDADATAFSVMERAWRALRMRTPIARSVADAAPFEARGFVMTFISPICHRRPERSPLTARRYLPAFCYSNSSQRIVRQ